MKLDWRYDFFGEVYHTIEQTEKFKSVKFINCDIKSVVCELCEIVNTIKNTIENISNLIEQNKQLIVDINLLKDEVFRLKYPDLKSFVKDKSHAVWSNLDPIHRKILRNYLQNEYKGIEFINGESPLFFTINIDGNRIVCLQQIIDECEQVVSKLKSNEKGGK